MRHEQSFGRKKSNICWQFKKAEEMVQIEFPDLNNL